MPALGMAQDTGKLIRWLKKEGESVAKGEPLMEIETDKAVVEVEAPAAGILANVSAHDGDVVPVAQVIALILAPGEAAARSAPPAAAATVETAAAVRSARSAGIAASPVAARIAEQHRVDLTQVQPRNGERITKADVLAYVSDQQPAGKAGNGGRLILASPKARRLAADRGVDLAALRGSGPGGAVLAADVAAAPAALAIAAPADGAALEVSRAWRTMAERLTQSWTSVPHFYLVREVEATRLVAWRDAAQARNAEKITYTDLLVKIVAAALRRHPRANASWNGGEITLNPHINIGLAVAVEEGLLVPVIHDADRLGLAEVAARRVALVERASAGRLRLEDLQGGTFTVSNLGMYGVDAFNAIVNPPQAAILAVGRIADRVVPVGGQPAVRPMMILSLSCDHRVIDGARGAQFLEEVAALIEEPLSLIE